MPMVFHSIHKLQTEDKGNKRARRCVDDLACIIYIGNVISAAHIVHAPRAGFQCLSLHIRTQGTRAGVITKCKSVLGTKTIDQPTHYKRRVVQKETEKWTRREEKGCSQRSQRGWGKAQRHAPRYTRRSIFYCSCILITWGDARPAFRTAERCSSPRNIYSLASSSMDFFSPFCPG